MRLNLGCGDQILPGFVNVDHRISNDTLHCIQDDIILLEKISDNYADFIYTSHVLQCIFPRSAVPIALSNWHRVLKVGGKIIIEVPNVIPLMKQYVEGKVPIKGLIQGVYGVDQEGLRQFTCFNFEYLKKLLEEVGFKNATQIYQPPYSRHDPNTNLVVEAEK